MPTLSGGGGGGGAPMESISFNYTKIDYRPKTEAEKTSWDLKKSEGR